MQNKITKRDCEFWHAKKRLNERYDLVFSKDLEKKILSLLNTKYSVFVERQTNARTIFLVIDPDSKIEYLFVKIKNGGIITFFNRVWLLKSFEEMVEINKNIQKKQEEKHLSEIKKINNELYEKFGLK